MFSDHSEIKLKITNIKVTGKSPMLGNYTVSSKVRQELKMKSQENFYKHIDLSGNKLILKALV
jgi:hypothetical protein